MGSGRHTIRLIISGRVQGVGYRAWVTREAGRRNLDGWVRNRGDGTVEALFAGPCDEVDIMRDACRRGPPHAAVTNITELPDTPDPGRGFRVLSTEG